MSTRSISFPRFRSANYFVSEMVARPHLKARVRRQRSPVPVRSGALTGRGVRVAVVDSGIAAHHPDVSPVAGGVGIQVVSTTEARLTDDFRDTIGHGTACASIIRALAPAAEMYAVKIFDRELVADVRALLGALEWCVDNRMHIASLSLVASCSGAAARHLRAVSSRAIGKGLMIIAAWTENESPCLPAEFPGVIAVRSIDCRDSREYRYFLDPVQAFGAKGGPQPLGALLPSSLREVQSRARRSELVGEGASLAVAHMAGLAALAVELSGYATPEKVRQLLIERAASGGLS